MKREKLTYIIHGLIILADFLLIFIFSILSIDFTEEKVSNPIFWINIIITQTSVMVAYFSMIKIGKIQENKSNDIVSIVDKTNEQFRIIDKTFLTNDLYETLNVENLKYRCEAYIEKINKKLYRQKNELKRKKLIENKIKCIEWLNYYEAINIGKSTDKPTNDFDITAIKVKSQQIDFHSFVAESEYYQNKKIGAIEERKVVSKDALTKIMISLIITLCFSAIRPDIAKSGWIIIYELVWRIFVITLNVYNGFSEGRKIISVYKKQAFLERQKILNIFLNKMFILGKIKDE